MGALLCKETVDHKDEENQLQEQIRPYYSQIREDERQRLDALFVQLRTLNEMSGTHIENARKEILNELEKDIRKQVQFQLEQAGKATMVKDEDTPVPPKVESLPQTEEVIPAQNDEENSRTGCECAECRAKYEDEEAIPEQNDEENSATHCECAECRAKYEVAGSEEDGVSNEEGSVSDVSDEERDGESGASDDDEVESGSGSEQESDGEEEDGRVEDVELRIQLDMLNQIMPLLQTVESEAAEREQLRKRVEKLESQSSKCCICLEEKPDILFTPCSHVCVCEGCFSPTSLWECPVCRERITGHSKIYL